MADKINNEEGIARVYQFLNKQKDWKTEADLNGNGTIVKSEFANYLYSSDFKFNSGENKKDLVDLFWKSIDFNTTGKVKAGSKTGNKMALDQQELTRMEDTLVATDRINDFMKGKEAPNELDEGVKSKWKKSVKQGLIYRASEYLKTGTIEEINDTWLAEAYRSSSAKATADYTATAEIDKQLGKVDGYASGDDEVLHGMIEKYIEQLEGVSKDESAVISDIKAIVAAYVDTANTNSNDSVNLLSLYGYDPDDDLNDLQRAVLTNELTTKIIDYIKANEPDIYVDGYKDQVEAMVKEFVEEYLYDKSASEFNQLKSFDVSEFTKVEEFTSLVTEIKEAQAKVRAAREELNTYIAGILAEKDDEKTAIVKEVIGAISADKVTQELLKLKTVEEIKAKRTALDAKLEQLSKTRAENAQKARLSNKNIDWSKMSSNKIAGNYVYSDGANQGMQSYSLSSLYSGGNCISLNGANWLNIKDESDNEAFGEQSYMSSCASVCKTNVNSIIDKIYQACISSELYNDKALAEAASKTKALYNQMLDALFDVNQRAGKKSDKTIQIVYDDEIYSANSSTWHKESTAGRSASSQSASKSQLGITLNISTNENDTYQCNLNVKCLMDMFQQFYAAAIG